MEIFSYQKKEHEGKTRYIVVGETRKLLKKGMMGFALKMKFDWTEKYWWTNNSQKINHVIQVLNKEAQKQEDFRQAGQVVERQGRAR